MKTFLTKVEKNREYDKERSNKSNVMSLIRNKINTIFKNLY